MTFEISDLRQRPEFFDVVADRIWRAWWKPNGVPHSYIEIRLRENLAGEDIPIALVAHDGGTFLGMASLIASDFDERPQYSPWVAAVWTEPGARSNGVGRTLVERACEEGFAFGHRRIYLSAAPNRRSYYTELGWAVLEDGVGPLQLSVLTRDRPS